MFSYDELKEVLATVSDDCDDLDRTVVLEWGIDIDGLVRFIQEGASTCPLAIIPELQREIAAMMLLGFQMGFETARAIERQSNEST